MWGQRIVKYRYVLILMCLVLSIFALSIAKDLEIATNLSDMLPQGHVLVEAIEVYESAFGSGEQVYIAIETPMVMEPLEGNALRHEAALRLVAILEASTAVARIDFGQPNLGIFLDAPNQPMTVVIVTPRLDEGDFVHARKVFFQTIQEAINKVEAELGSIDSELVLAYTGGAFVQDYEADAMLEEGIFTSLGLVLCLVLLVVSIVFKRLWVPVLLSLPLVMGVVVTAAIGRLLFGTLNLFSVFFAAVLFGLGIDFGVHLLARFDALRQHNLSVAQALDGALKTSGIGIVIGAVTTASAFLSFTVTSFKGFRQMGTVAGVGILVLAALMLVMVPAMIAVLELSNKRPQHAVAVKQRVKPRKLCSFMIRVSLVGLMGLSLLGVFGSIGYEPFGLKTLSFDYSLSAIYPTGMKSTEWQQRLEEAYDTRIESLSVVMPSVEALEKAHVALQSLETNGEIKTKSLLTVVRHMVKQPLLTGRDLKDFLPQVPSSTIERWVGTSGGRSVYRLEVTPTGPIVTLEQFEDLERQIKDATEMQPVGFVALMMHLGKVVTSDVLLVGSLCAALILLFLVLSFKHWFMPMGMILGLTLTLLSTWGLASLFSLSLNIMSVIAFPIVIGIAIDGFVHMGHGLVHRKLDDDFSDLYRALTVTTLTTIIGFGSLGLVNHGGLANLGRLTALAMGIAFCYQGIFMPVWYRFGVKKGIVVSANK